MLMIPGKAPYARIGNESMDAAVQRMEFPYPCGEQHNTGVPAGGWRFMWSHLPRYIKEYFYHTFQKGGKYSTESTRLSSVTWLSVFNRYLYLLQNGLLQKKDEQSGYIFPTRWKIGGTQIGVTTLKRICSICGNTFELTPDEENYYRINKFYLPNKCPVCRQFHQFDIDSENQSAD